jgi:hypothetical protein
MSLLILSIIDDLPQNNLAPPQPPQPENIKTELIDMSLWVDYVYLDTDERRRFAQTSHEYLITQVQSNYNNIRPGRNQIQLNFNHPVKEISWFIEQPDFGYDYFAIADTSEDCVNKAKLVLNNQDREKERDGSYFRCVIPYDKHIGGYAQGLVNDIDGIPEHQGGFYQYSFSLNPDEYQPSGTCNFSRIDNSVLVLDINNVVNPSSRIKYFARNYNVLRIMSGMGGLAYSN